MGLAATPYRRAGSDHRSAAVPAHLRDLGGRTLPGYRGHAHFWERALSRRGFGRTVAGTTALIAGAAAPWPTGAVAAPASPGRQNADPRPIPGGTDLFHLLGLPPGPTFHVYFPAFRQEVSTITDFNGFVAAAEIQGTGTATDTSTHTTTTLTYDADMRLMDGVYVGVDGHTYKGTFGFIWLDLFTGQFAQQIHDFNPGITSSGLFWTMPIPRDSVFTNLGQATATMRLDNLAIPDYHDIFNSVGATQPRVPPTPSVVSFDVRWQGKAGPVEIRDTAHQFAGLFIDSTATISWSASQPATHFSFTSAPPATSTTVSGVIGRERNGTFFG